MNPFKALENIQEDYKRYVFSFQRFKNPAIREWVEERVREGTLLWKDPHIQLNRNFQKGETLESMMDRGLLHQGALDVFTTKPGEEGAVPIKPYKHQSDAVKRILGEDKNIIVSTGTGSGKSFCFGIPIINSCLEMKDRQESGIKAIIVYPMNALANSQYEDFSRRLHGSGLTIALYTGDTETSPAEALSIYRDTTGRRKPWDSELLSREEIQNNPPDILMTNYVMLDLIFSRFDDRVLFPTEHKERLKYLVLDEIHTYTGQKGADVACLIRRVKQRTGTKGKIRCIGTSATVQAGEGEDGAEIVSNFAQRLFEEPFAREDVVGEMYEELEAEEGTLLSPEPQVSEELLKLFEPSIDSARELLEALINQDLSHQETPLELGETLAQTRTFSFLKTKLHESSHSIEDLTKAYQKEVRPGANYYTSKRELEAALLVGTVTQIERENKTQPSVIPKIHTFFSQGRAISSCLIHGDIHLNDRGEAICPECIHTGNQRTTFPLNFCRACGQEYYGASVMEDGNLVSRDIDTEVKEGESIYLYPELYDQEQQPLPEDWYENEVKIKKNRKIAVPYNTVYCPECNRLDPPQEQCFGHTKVKVAVIPMPFLFCPSCGVHYDKRTKREFNKLFTFGSVGRSTATDVLLSSTLENLPDKERKVIAFSDNRQDTALQAAHINNLQKRIHFRRGLYQSLLDRGNLEVKDAGHWIFKHFEREKMMPEFSLIRSKYRQNTTAARAFRDYLTYNTIQDLRASQQKNQQNLEEVGLIKASYNGLEMLIADDELWSSIPELVALDHVTREDFFQGFLDIFRKQRAIQHPSINRPFDFDTEVISKLEENCLFHVERYGLPSVGYSDTADSSRRSAKVLRVSSARSRLVLWCMRVLGVEHDRAKALAEELVETLAMEDVGFLVKHHIRRTGDLYMLPAEGIMLETTNETNFKKCKKCGSIYHFKKLNKCIEPGCQDLEPHDFTNNYFRQIYQKDFDETVKIEAKEHSGQVDGNERKDIEHKFKDPAAALNTIICTPTMELGIDIGDLSTVYMRNVPPSPSNYAQRSGRAGRKNQPSIITTFCGVGSRRGPHDQYFYKHPDKIIAGQITPPRFLLDNRKLIRTHLHSLILEETDTKFPTKPMEVLETGDAESGFPMKESLKTELRDKVDDAKEKILTSAKEAFQDEIEAFSWLDETFILNTINRFVQEMDDSFRYWRREYESLLRERNLIHKKGATQKLSKDLNIRRTAIEAKLVAMREGDKKYTTYGYLRTQGFLPIYGFPASNAILSLSDVDDEISRDKLIAIREFAPGNTIYFKNQKYTISRARPRTDEQKPVREALLICPTCDAIFLGDNAKNLSSCPECGESFEHHHPNFNTMEFPDMYAKKGNRITSDEEERVRLGYNVSCHYEKGTDLNEYVVEAGDTEFRITYEHNGTIITVNKGTYKTTEDGQEMGFVFCTACNQWLFGKKAANHLDKNKDGHCPRSAEKDDLISGIFLFTKGGHDVLTLDIPPPADIAEDEREAFYVSVKEALLQGVQISLNIDESELRGMLKPKPQAKDEYLIILFEKAEGGMGIVKFLTENARLKDILSRAKQILHRDEKGCEKACYECLLSYYNQVEHPLLDRTLALRFLDTFTTFEIKEKEKLDNLAALKERCDSDFEKAVLDTLVESGIRLPDEAQKVVYDKKGTPIAKPDFIYKPNVLVFVDGLDHEKGYVKEADQQKRYTLKALGYVIVSITKLAEVEDLKNYVR